MEKMSKDSSSLNLGDIVLFDEHDLGVVRFVGVVKRCPSGKLIEGNSYIGIELKGGSDARTRYAAELMDGTVDGIEYFSIVGSSRKGLGNGLMLETSRIKRKITAEELLNKVASLWSVIRNSSDTSEVSRQMIHRDVYNEAVIENERLRIQLIDGQVLIQSLQMENEILRGDSAKKMKDNAELNQKVSKWADQLGLSHMRRPTLSALSQDSIDKIHDILRSSTDTGVGSEEASSGRYTLSSPQSTPDGYVPPVISRRTDSSESRGKRARGSKVLDLNPDLKQELSEIKSDHSEGDSEEEQFDAMGYSKGSLRRKKPAAKHRSRESQEIPKRDIDAVTDDGGSSQDPTTHTKSKLSMDLEQAPDWIAGDLDSSKAGVDGSEEEAYHPLATGMEVLPDSRKMYSKHGRNDSLSSRAAKTGLITGDTSDAKGSFAPTKSGGSSIAGVAEDSEDYTWEDIPPAVSTATVDGLEGGHRKRGSMDMDVTITTVGSDGDAGHDRVSSISSVLSENNYFNQID